MHRVSAEILFHKNWSYRFFLLLLLSLFFYDSFNIISSESEIHVNLIRCDEAKSTAHSPEKVRAVEKQ